MFQQNEPETFDQSIKPDRWQVIQRQLLVLVLSLVALLLLFQLSIYFADILRILVFSILFSYLFINVVDWLDKILHNRATSILIVYLILFVGLIISIVLIVPAVVYQVSQLINTTFDQFPQIIQSIVNALRPLENRLHDAQIQIKAIDILTNLASSLPKPDPSLLLARATDVAMSTMTWLFYFLSIVVLSFYFLLDGHRIKEAIIRTFPARHYVSLVMLAADVDLTVQAFFRGQIVLGLLFGALMFAVYTALGIHYALLLCVALAAWEIVPVIGPTIGFLPTLVSVALDGMDAVHTNRWAQVLLVFLLFNVLQWLKDNVVAPKYIGDVIGLHPVMIFLAIMIGARFDGMAGIICSLPAACVINVLANHLTMRANAAKRNAQYTRHSGLEANAQAVVLMREMGLEKGTAHDGSVSGGPSAALSG